MTTTFDLTWRGGFFLVLVKTCRPTVIIGQSSRHNISSVIIIRFMNISFVRFLTDGGDAIVFRWSRDVSGTFQVFRISWHEPTAMFNSQTSIKVHNSIDFGHTSIVHWRGRAFWTRIVVNRPFRKRFDRLRFKLLVTNGVSHCRTSFSEKFTEFNTKFNIDTVFVNSSRIEKWRNTHDSFTSNAHAKRRR